LADAGTQHARDDEPFVEPEADLVAVPGAGASDGSEVPALTRPQMVVLMLTVLMIAMCGIVYELAIASVSSYLLGNSVLQFSITIGLFMFAMGVGSYLTKLIGSGLIARFIAIELAIAIVGGISVPLLFMVFPYSVFYRPAMYGLIIIIGILVGLEIPILTRVVNDSGGLRQSLANVLALDYLGALVGAVAFPLLLLPFLGLFKASFGIGLLNALVAMINIIMFRHILARRKLWYFASAASIVFLVGLLVSAATIMQYAEAQLYGDQIIYSQQTQYQRIVMTRNDLTGRHRLYLDGHLQFAQWDEYRYHESLVHPMMSVPGPRASVLILGGGDGMAAREALKYSDVQRIDLVDIDPAMTQLCSTMPTIAQLNQGALDDPKVTIHNDDAFAFLRESDRHYDRVIIDLPDPHNEALSKLYSVEFYRLLRMRLAERGLFVTQSSSPWATRRTYWSIAKTIETAGMELTSYHVAIPTFSIWGFHLGTANGRAPTEFNIVPATRFITASVMAAATVFPPDTQRVEATANSIFEPQLYLTYLREVNQ
jgi:spermidine synthase